jgi:hypothetical protein
VSRIGFFKFPINVLAGAKITQQSPHWTLGILRDLQTFFCSQRQSMQTVGQPRTIHISSKIKK